MKARLLTRLLWGCLVAQSAAAETVNLETRIADCPGMMAWQSSMEAESQQRTTPRRPPTQPKLRTELLALMELDQAVRMVFIRAQRKPTAAELTHMARTDAEHQQRIKSLIHAQGFPSATEVGPDGSNAAFLLVQHATDASFQAEALTAMEPLLAAGEVSRADYALLFDRVSLAQGKPQRYGSQFKVQDGVNVLERLEAPAQLDARRREMGLPPITAYACAMQIFDGRKVDLSVLTGP